MYFFVLTRRAMGDDKKSVVSAEGSNLKYINGVNRFKYLEIC